MPQGPEGAAEAVLGGAAARRMGEVVKAERARRGFADHVTADSLVSAWTWLVAEIEEGYSEMVPEYANDLDARMLLDLVLAAAPDDLATRLRAWIDPLDRRFLDATYRSSAPFHGSADPAGPYGASPWHWRIPKKLVGQLKDDLEASGLA